MKGGDLVGMDVKFTDNSKDVLKTMQDAKDAALEAMGTLAENYAKGNITSAGRVDTGNLRNSVAHTVKEDTAYVGTNSEYAIFH